MSRCPNPDRAGTAGFTLLEVLIAFTIAALALPALFGAFGDGLGLIDRAQERGTLLRMAESRLAVVGAEIPLAAGVHTGADDRGAWQVTIEERGRFRFGDGRPPLVLLAVAVEVTDAVGRGQRLDSLRVATGP